MDDEDEPDREPEPEREIETAQDRENERRIAAEVIAASKIIVRVNKLEPIDVLDFECFNAADEIVGYSEAKQVQVPFGVRVAPMFGFCIPLRKVRKAEQHWAEKTLPTYAWIHFEADGRTRIADVNDWARDIEPYMLGRPGFPYHTWQPHVTIRWEAFTRL